MTSDEHAALLAKASEADNEEQAKQVLMEGGIPEDVAAEIAARLFGRNLDVL